MAFATRTKFTEQLNDVEDLLKRFADKTCADIRAVDLVAKGDDGAAEGVTGGRKEENRLRGSIEDTCFDIMLLQQPLIGEDFRFVTGAFRVVSDLSHIDGMTRDAVYLLQEVPAEEAGRLADEYTILASNAAVMVANAVKAFLKVDVEKAEQVIESDETVNNTYAKAEEKLVRLIRDESISPRYLPELLMVAKYFERMGDLGKAIADWAIFRATGKHNGDTKAE